MQITAQSILFALGFLGFILADSMIPDDMNVDDSDTTPVASSLTSTTPKHSQCYNYFLNKDHCVYSAKKKSERCPSSSKDECGRPIPTDQPIIFKAHSSHSSQNTLAMNVSPEGITAFASQTTTDESSAELSTPPSKRLVRRYDSEDDSFTIAGGNGICGVYDENQPGVCIWASGNDVSGSRSGGWLNSTYTKACGRQVYIMRKGKTNPEDVVYAPIVDGCSFNAEEPEPGCFRIAFTNATFNALNPTDAEAKSLVMKDLIWNFDNEQGTNPKNAAT
ncbi:hypothetical protein PTTG_03653 [Puccinia triticina 1-1 BBBD Race 1]|uniref:Secreted protein n=2 Tax=Puccinia triticina TaxID=208348 RepID=A0A0C4ES79_PUCT1|nr:uncharacterized protein PtA15_3A485 [Puccinia triticina]OAV95297.1 hypothetical protein PTTG_03653 [Puccinia triticina 1-1 BBBD Race 1]WAQ83118.1 hypothetical protein PtA15_3A485 [Puccinia triticina]WAR53960.1 hypothetical protein PtB15_3B469 [Puccinia triticina]